MSRAADTTLPPSTRALLLLFAIALAVRCAYAIAMYAFFGIDGLKGPNSGGYLDLARDLAAGIAAGKISGWAWLGADLSVMPFFMWVITAVTALTGSSAAISFTLLQAVLDAGTCLFVVGMARVVAPRAALLAGYAAAFTPTLIVLSGLVYTDTLFVFFCAGSLYAALRWMQTPHWRWAILLGVTLGLGAMVRLVIAPWGLPLALFMAIVLLIRRQPFARLTQLVAAGAIAAVCLAPVLARNVSLYGAWSLTPQSGHHTLNWVFPLVKEFVDGTPREATVKANEAKVAERFGPMPTKNPFAESARLNVLAQEELLKLGIAGIARGWLYGAAINLASPAVVHVPPVSALPRRGFYDTPGTNFREKLEAFLFGSGNNLYAWLLLLGLAGVALFRLVQLVGLIALLRRGADIAGLLLLVGWCLYILAINGPVASPKYRLPLEPALAVLTGAGLSAFKRRKAIAP